MDFTRVALSEAFPAGCLYPTCHLSPSVDLDRDIPGGRGRRGIANKTPEPDGHDL